MQAWWWLIERTERLSMWFWGWTFHRWGWYRSCCLGSKGIEEGLGGLGSVIFTLCSKLLTLQKWHAQWGTPHDNPPKSRSKKCYPTKFSDTKDDHNGPAGPNLTSASELEYLAFVDGSVVADGDGEASDDELKISVARKVSHTYHNCIMSPIFAHSMASLP